jgi:hypothetical protein
MSNLTSSSQSGDELGDDVPHFLLPSLQKVVAAAHDVKDFGGRQPIHQAAQDGKWGKVIEFAGHKELGARKGPKEIGIERPLVRTQPCEGVGPGKVGIVVPGRQAYGRRSDDAEIVLSVGQPNPGPERIADHRQTPEIDARLGLEPVEGAGHVGPLAPAVIVPSAAALDTPEVEAQSRDSPAASDRAMVETTRLCMFPPPSG